MKQRIFTLEQIYREGIRILAQAGIEESSLDAWYLLEYVTGISRAYYYGHPKEEVEKATAQRYIDLIHIRSRRVPLQHITGEQVFMGYSFCVNKHVLIPRQDTEILVEEVEEALHPGMKLLDLCTGSGCILLSLLKRNPQITGTGCDISEEALKVAEENARRLGVEATLIQSDLFGSVKERYEIIVSNPPYIRTSVIKELQAEVRLHDPYIALDGREDGLHFYRKIIEGSTDYISPGGYLMFEIGHDQADAVSELMKDAGYREIMVKKDLAGLDRVVTGMYNKE